MRSSVALMRYLCLFEISFFSILSSDEHCIIALIAWEEDCVDGIPSKEDLVKVKWEYDNFSQLEDALFLGECLYEGKLIDNDRIIVDYTFIEEKTNWSHSRMNKALDDLQEIVVHEIEDNGDAFFLHL